MKAALPFTLVLLAAVAVPALAAQVHQCAPLLAPELCANAYVLDGPVAGAELYTHARAHEGSVAVHDMHVHDGRLYVVRGNGSLVSTGDGVTWRNEAAVPFNPMPGCGVAFALGSLGDDLYAASSGLGSRGQGLLWRHTGAAWTLAFVTPLGDGSCHIYDLHQKDGLLYVATSSSRVYTWNGTAATLVLNIGLGTSGALNSLAEGSDGRLFATAFPSGIWTRSASGAWSLVPGTNGLYGYPLAASGGHVHSVNGNRLLRVTAAGAASFGVFPGSTVDFVRDLDGWPGVGLSGSLVRFDGVAATEILAPWGLSASARFGDATYVGNRQGDVERLQFLVSERPRTLDLPH